MSRRRPHRWPVLSRRQLLVGVATLVAIVLVATGLLWWHAARVTGLEQAISLAPDDAARVTYVDWAAIRTELDSPVSPSSSLPELRAFLQDGFTTDLTMPSALKESAETLHQRFGFSPAGLAWESLAQSEEGAVLTLALGEDTSVASVASHLAELGYQRPEEPDGVWRGGPGVVAGLDGVVSPALAHFVLLADRGLLLASDRASYLPRARAAVRGEGAMDPGAAVDAAGEVLAAIHFHDGYGCRALAMGQAGPDDQQLGESLVTDAGGLDPYDGLVVAALTGDRLRMTMSFATAEQARHNATARARLAQGPAAGQAGRYPDMLRLESATATDEVVTLAIEPKDTAAYLFSDLSSGPVLLAGC